MITYEKDYEANCYIALDDRHRYLCSIHIEPDGYSATIHTSDGNSFSVYKNDIRSVVGIIEVTVNNCESFVGGSTIVHDDSRTKVYLLHFDDGVVITTFYVEVYRWAHNYAKDHLSDEQVNKNRR